MGKHYKVLNYFGLVSLILTNLFISKSHSQISEKKYFPIALVVGSDIIVVSNDQNAADYKLLTTTSLNLGINYRIWEGENLILDVGVIIRSYAMNNKFKFGLEDLPDGYEAYGGENSFSSYTQYKIPIILNYKVKNNDNSSFLLGLGTQFLVYPDDPTTGVTTIWKDGSDIEYGYLVKGESGKVIQPGVLFNAEINFKTKYLSICPHLEYYFSPGDLYTNTVTTENLISQNTITNHKIKNSYFGFGISVYPAKSLFKRSKG